MSLHPGLQGACLALCSSHNHARLLCPPTFVDTQGVPARQHDAWDLGFTTNDDFGNADIIYQDTLPKVRDTCHWLWAVGAA